VVGRIFFPTKVSTHYKLLNALEIILGTGYYKEMEARGIKYPLTYRYRK
jgi:hypothetical protein